VRAADLAANRALRGDGGAGDEPGCGATDVEQPRLEVTRRNTPPTGDVLSAFCPCTHRESVKRSATDRRRVARYFAGLSRVVVLSLARFSTVNPEVAGSSPVEPAIFSRVTRAAATVAAFTLLRTLPSEGSAMLESQQRVAVWLRDSWGRELMGAPPIPTMEAPSRWVAVGTVVENAPQGSWLNSGRFEEWTPDGTRTAYKFKPPTLLIQWAAIITVQVVDGDEKEIGFKPDR
jgi:hypothetical protein